MKKSSMIFKMICLAVAAILCISMVTVLADDVVETEEIATGEEIVTETEEEIIEDAENVTEAENAEDVTEIEDETVVEDEVEVEEETEVEILDLWAATLRDNGEYVQPSDDNAAAFDYDGLHYRVPAGTGNSIKKIEGFETGIEIYSEIDDAAKDKLKAEGEIIPEAAHSGHFGLALTDDMVYRSAVTGGQVYVFSAWMKLPSGGAISESDRAFRVVAEDGSEYIVGWNKIGREIENKYSWQQVLFTFKAPKDGLFVIDFTYRGKTPLYIDDVELYEAEIFENPLTIKEILCLDADGNKYDKKTGFSTSGVLTHTTTLYNEDENDVHFVGVMALYKNGILFDFETVEEVAYVLDNTDVTFEIEIPEDEDLSQYSYLVYFISDTNPTQFYGQLTSLEYPNPYVVNGVNGN